MDPVVIVAIIGFAGILVSSLVGPLIINRANAKRDEKREKQRKEREQRESEKEREWHEAVDEYIKPVAADVANVKESMSGLNGFMILDLRVNMKQMRDRVVDLKFPADGGEKSTFEDLYKKYYALGGNSFHSYVDGWALEFGFTKDELKEFKDEVDKERENRA